MIYTNIRQVETELGARLVHFFEHSTVREDVVTYYVFAWTDDGRGATFVLIDSDDWRKRKRWWTCTPVKLENETPDEWAEHHRTVHGMDLRRATRSCVEIYSRVAVLS